MIGSGRWEGTLDWDWIRDALGVKSCHHHVARGSHGVGALAYTVRRLDRAVEVVKL